MSRYIPCIYRLFDRHGTELLHYQCSTRWIPNDSAVSDTIRDLLKSNPKAIRATVDLALPERK